MAVIAHSVVVGGGPGKARLLLGHTAHLGVSSFLDSVTYWESVILTLLEYLIESFKKHFSREGLVPSEFFSI